MILTKSQIIDIELAKNFKGKVPTRLKKRLLNQPDNLFIESVKKQLNWNLEPIRKYQYIVK